MASAISARQDGDAWQAYLFWREAIFMLNGHDISRVGFEVEEFRAFDDVAVAFKAPRQNGCGQLIHADYYQVKFSAAFTKKITSDDLVDPRFINADKFSLLERLRDAARLCETSGRRCRFVLVAPWPVDPDDLLGKLVDSSTGAIRIGALREGKTDKSAMGALRKNWRDVLKVQDEELFTVLGYLSIKPRYETLEDSRRNLNMGLSGAGLQRISDLTLTDPYSQLIWRLHRQGQHWFALEDVIASCKQEGLYLGAGGSSAVPRPRILGVRSFMRWAENLEDETDAMVCLTHNFSQRQIRDASLWKSSILPSLKDFLSAEVKAGTAVELELQTHATLAFITGYLIEPKAGVRVAIRQRSINGVELWSLGRSGEPAGGEDVQVKEMSLGYGNDLACALSVTHDTCSDVQSYLAEQGYSGRLLHVSVGSPSQTAVKNGDDAYRLAAAAVHEMAKRRGSNEGPLHLFMSVPNGLAFLAGQLSRALGEVQLYEFDFGGSKGYSKSALLTPSHALAPRHV